MFTWGNGCKHTVFFALRAKGQRTLRAKGQRTLRDKELHAAPPEHFAQFVHMAHSFTSRAFCTICSQWHAAHSLRASCLP